VYSADVFVGQVDIEVDMLGGQKLRQYGVCRLKTETTDTEQDWLGTSLLKAKHALNIGRTHSLRLNDESSAGERKRQSFKR